MKISFHESCHKNISLLLSPQPVARLFSSLAAALHSNLEILHDFQHVEFSFFDDYLLDR